jgi:hypothetical protein
MPPATAHDDGQAMLRRWGVATIATIASVSHRAPHACARREH